MTSRICSTVVACALLAAASHAVVVLSFDNYFDGPTVPDGPAPWATLTIEDLSPGLVSFRLENLTPPAATNKIKSLWLNMDPFVGGAVLTPTSGHAVASFTAKQDAVNGAGSSKWDAKIGFSTSGIGFSGGMVSEWTLAAAGLSETNFLSFADVGGLPSQHLAMLHVLSAGANNDSTHVTATAVPGPPTVLTFTLGLLGAHLRRRRRSSPASA